MTKREQLAALMKSDGKILSLIAQWASLNRDIGLRDEREPTGGLGGVPTPAGGDAEQTQRETSALRAEREECARRYNAREQALRTQVGL